MDVRRPLLLLGLLTQLVEDPAHLVVRRRERLERSDRRGVVARRRFAPRRGNGRRRTAVEGGPALTIGEAVAEILKQAGEAERGFRSTKRRACFGQLTLFEVRLDSLNGLLVIPLALLFDTLTVPLFGRAVFRFL